MRLESGEGRVVTPSFLRFYAATVLIWMALPVLLKADDRLAVTVRATREAYAAGDAVQLELTFRNVSQQTVVLYPGFAPVESPAFPDTVVIFEVTGPDGSRVERIAGTEEMLRRKRIRPYDFRELQPGWFFGGPFYVNRPPFSYPFKARGKYRVRVRVSFRGAEWLKTAERQEDTEGTWSFSPELMASGTVETDEVTVEIR